MKRVLAFMLAGCMVLQPLSGYCLTADAAETEAAVGADAAVAEAADGAVATVSTAADDAISMGGTAVADDAVSMGGIAAPDDAISTGGTVAEDDAAADDAVSTGGTAVADDAVSVDGIAAADDAASIDGTVAEDTAETLPSGDAGEFPAADTGVQDAAVGDGSFDAEGAGTVDDSVLSDDAMIIDEIITVDDTAEFENVPESDPVTEDVSGRDTGLAYEAEPETVSGSEAEDKSEPDLADLASGIQTVSLDEWAESYIEVKVVATLPFLDSKEVKISLVPETAEEGTALSQSETVKIAVPNGADGTRMAAASEKFPVAPGSYIVTLQASQFAQYTQTIAVKKHETARIELCTSKVGRPDEKSGISGWLRIGDADGDGNITDDDVDQIMSALHAGLEDSMSDLNANGVVDLADLQLAVQSLDESQEATVAKLAVPRRAEHDEQTKIEGIDSLLNDSGKATLTPANGEAISKENPVSVAFDFGAGAEDDESQAGTELPKLGGMTLQAPVRRNEETGELSSDITGGSVLVEAAGENGESVYYEIPLVQGTEPAQQPALAYAAGPSVAEISGQNAADGAEHGSLQETTDNAENVNSQETANNAENVNSQETTDNAENVNSQETADNAENADSQEAAAQKEAGVDAAAEENVSEDVPASIMLMTVGVPADAFAADAADTITVDAVEEIDAAEVPSEIAAAAGQGTTPDDAAGAPEAAVDNDASGDGTSGAEAGQGTIPADDPGAIADNDASGDDGAPEASGDGQPAEEPKNITTLEPAALEMDGSFVLNFGGQIAVKRITISITGTKQTQALAEIARVQFVNDMESRIPAPNLNIPEIKEITPKNEELVVDWAEQSNVTGYEIEVSGPVKKADGEQTQIVRVATSPHTIVSINDKSLINYEDYRIRVRSVNGEWSSPWTAVATAQPKPEKGPDRVDNVTAKGGFRSVKVSWKDMDDANGYMLFYREKGAAEYTPAVEGYALPKDGEGRLMQTSYTITGLKDLTTYEIYVIAWNDFDHGAWGNNAPGTSAGPRVAEATTESGDTPRLPKYQLINTYGDGSYDDKAEGAVGRLTDHIVSAVCGTHGSQKMVESALDQEKEQTDGVNPTVNGKTRQHARWALGTVDNSYASYWIKNNEWDDGVSYPVGDFSKGVTVTFDAPYKMNYLTFTAADLQGNVETAKIVYWKDQDEIDADAAGEAVNCSVVRCLDETNRPYYVVKFDETVTAKQLLLYIGTYNARIDLKIAEIHFHHYNEDVDGAVEALFKDPAHSVLSDELAALAAENQEAALARIDEVQAIVETPDEATGEYHPLKDFLLLDLKGARELVSLQLDEPFYVDSSITAAKDGHINFGGLNAWQPLGRVAATGEKLTIYVGHNAKSIGQVSNLQLICTQYHAESNALSIHYTLKVGKNELTLGQITSTGGKERGGQLYIAYTGNNPKDQYAVRVNGGAKIPVLNIYNKSGDEKKAAIRAYVSELEEYVAKIESEHERLHYNDAEAAKKDKNGANTSYVYFPYDDHNCFLNATDLMADHMMYSVPATQIWNAIADREDKAAAVENGLDAMEKTMTLFYQHKGLFKGAGGNRETPSRHLNIRYMQMFSGAFMYASGNHIGVEFPETRLAMAGSWDGFGWGVAHEIGHDINDPRYAIAEITNNYFAQLLTKAANKDHATRFNYKDVYEKVTSGAIGRSPNGAVQLALYWQLHLAFDNFTEQVGDYRDDRYIFDDYQEMFDNLFFARVDTYSRNPGQAPKNSDKDKAVELKMVSDIDQNLMRLACAAAKENLLPFFERWGMVPDEDTAAFAAQYGAPTEKAYYYVNDDARNYRADNKDNEESLKITDAKAAVTVDETATTGNRVALKLSTDADETRRDAILGYEIVRSTYWRGKKQDAEVIGFTLADADGNAAYTDVIASLDNRVLYYETRAVDKFLNYSQLSDTVSARVSTGGALGKSLWAVETTITADEGQDTELKGDDHPDGGFDGDNSTPAVKYGVDKVIDGQVGDAFLGTAAAGAMITIDMQKPMAVTSVKYNGKPLGAVTISVSSDKSSWVTVKEKYDFTGTGEDGAAQTIWFDAVQAAHKDSWIGTYDARYVRFVIQDEVRAEIDEIDICGPSGDDVSFYDNVAETVGIAANTCTYAVEDGEALTIPKGALIFTGSYKGNPAYNMVMLYDDAVVETKDGSVRHGNVVGADLTAGKVYAEQVILADVPANGNLGETSDGKWIYFVTPPDGENRDDAEAVKAHSKKIYEGLLSEGKGRVRAELYRVDNALTLEGERIVSDTAFLTLPESFDKLSEITLEIKVPGQEQQAE